MLFSSLFSHKSSPPSLFYILQGTCESLISLPEGAKVGKFPKGEIHKSPDKVLRGFDSCLYLWQTFSCSPDDDDDFLFFLLFFFFRFAFVVCSLDDPKCLILWEVYAYKITCLCRPGDLKIYWSWALNFRYNGFFETCLDLLVMPGSFSRC